MIVRVQLIYHILLYFSYKFYRRILPIKKVRLNMYHGRMSNVKLYNTHKKLKKRIFYSHTNNTFLISR